VQLEPGGSYLISGGLGDLGLLSARWIAGQGGVHLILLIRTPLPPRTEWGKLDPGSRQGRQAAAVLELEALGAAVTLAEVDISDDAALRLFLEEYVCEGHPPVRGVIHAAGVLEDRLLEEMDMQALERVFQAKIQGGWALHSALQHEPLDFFVLFSSVASLLSQPGQGNYAAANAFLDALARYRRAQGLPALAVNWGPWKELGFAATPGGRRLVAALAHLGVQSLEPVDAFKALELLLAQEAVQTAVLPVDWQKYRATSSPGSASPLLERLLGKETSGPAGEPRSGAAEWKSKLHSQLQGLPDEQQVELLVRYLCQRIGRVMQMPDSAISAKRNILELGVDSIMVMELVRELERDLQLRLYPREVFERPSVEALAEYLAAEFNRSKGNTVTAVMDDPNALQPSAAVQKLVRETVRVLDTKPVQRNPSMVFLLSAPRSGSTLLRVMLAGHPGLFCPPELHLLPFNTLGEWKEKLGRTYLDEGLIRAFMELKGLDPESGKEYVQSLVDQDLPVQEVYALLQDLAQPRLLVDKSPSYAADLAILQRAEELFTDPRYIFLVRHPYTMIQSSVKMRIDRLLDAQEADPYFFSEQVWATSNSNSLDFLGHLAEDRYRLVHFEDLVRAPEQEGRKLCEFLGLPFNERLLNPYEGARMTDGVYTRSMGVGDPNFMRHATIDPALGEAWKATRLPKPLGPYACHVASELGYMLPNEPQARTGLAWPESDQADSLQSIPAMLKDAEAASRGFPLSFAQERLWFLEKLASGTALYNVPAMACRLLGSLDMPAMERTLGEIVRRQASLRTRFLEVEGQPLQQIDPWQPFHLPVIDLMHLPVEQRQAEALRQAAGLVQRAFDLQKGPLFQAALFRLAPEDHLFVAPMHHIITDGWSIGVFAREIEILYTAAVRGEPFPLPDLPLQYTDFSAWQRQRLQGKVLADLLEYWKGKLAGLQPVLELPLDHPRPVVQTFQGMRIPFSISPTIRTGLKALGREHGATLFMTLLAAFETLLYRYTGQEDFAVGSPIAGRSQPETRDLIGLFGNTLVLRSSLSGGWSFSDLLAHVRETALGAYENQDLPFEKLVEALQPERSTGHSPLFQVMFILQNEPLRMPRLPGLEVAPIDLDSGTSKFDLSVSLLEGEHGLTGWFEFNTELFEPATIQRMQEHFRILLAGVIAAPHQQLDELPLLSPAETKRVLVEWNATKTDYPAEACLPDLFEAQAACTPGQPSLVFGNQSCTYQELDRRANGLANLLQQNGVAPDVLVAISIERSIDMATAVLSVLKAGGAYVPLDPAYPTERLAYVLADTRAPVLLTQSHLVQRLPEHSAQVICLDEIDWQVLYQDLPPERTIAPENLAYVLYTSGSTGRPKGIAMPHRPLVNLIQWQLQHWTLPASARTLQYASLSFDVSFQEIFSTWCSGGALFMIPEDLRHDPYALLLFIDDQKIERLFLPFVALQQLAEASETYAQAPLPGSLRDIITAGEQLQITPQILRLFERLKGCKLHNHYGPTEAHVVTAYTLEGAPQDWPRLPPIGRPIANAQIYILNSSLQPVPPGCSGELYISGTCLSRGYLNRPELTAQRFIDFELPLSGIAEGLSPSEAFCSKIRVYRTGDTARFTADGMIEYLGRSDDQLKIRGFRVEPGEIEVLLGKHPAVRQVAVVPRRSPAGDQRLVAYIVANGEANSTNGGAGGASPHHQLSGSQSLLLELQDLACQQLPEYMLPSAYVFSDGLPVTPSGKINRRALPEPDWAQPARTGSFTPPQTQTEKKIGAIWAGLLGAEPQDIHTSFFDAGGHSLLALQLVAKIQQALGVDIPLRQLFEDATIAGLGRAVDELQLQKNRPPTTPDALAKLNTVQAPLPPSLVAVQPHGDRPPFICIHPAGGLVYLYYELAYQIGLEQPFWGIQDMSLSGQVEIPGKVEDYAAVHLQSIRALQPEGPYYLGGWSFGGLIAYEIACRLRQQGQPVSFLGLFDTEMPRTLQGASLRKKLDYGRRNIAAYLAGTREAITFLRDGWYLARRYLSRKKDHAEQLSFAEQVRLLSLNLLRNSFLRGSNVEELLTEHPVLWDVPVPSTSTSQFLKIFRANARSYHHYRPQPYPGKVTLFLGDHQSKRRTILYGKDETLGWGSLVTAGVGLRTVPGNHMIMFQKPYVVEFARILKAELERAQMEPTLDGQAN
jgi:amino acid adenylation domain-containing protein